MSIIVWCIMMVILVASVVAPNARCLPPDCRIAGLCWVVLFLVIGAMELLLLRFYRANLSNQMQCWVRTSPFGLLMGLFWLWLAYHFTIEALLYKK